jgi:diguanylate cyclase (GGDEF)-like protein
MMISGSQTIDNAIEAIRAGAFDFIKKPFDLDHVEMAVRRALDHHRLLEEKRKHEEKLEELVAERTKQLNFLAYYDGLTGLPNRMLFENRLDEALARAGDDCRIATMLVSPNRFKDIRDTLGHSFGNQILKEFSRRLEEHKRPEVTIARFETDEFAVLLPKIADTAGAIVIIGEIFEALDAPFSVETHEVCVTAAIGVSLYPDDGTDSQTITKNAGAALSRAKTSGSNKYQFYTANMHAQALRRLRLESDLRQAFEKREFETHYQPKVDMNSGKIVGMEALIRWRHADLGMIPPTDFIPIAEESGLIFDIGEWVLRSACTQTRLWHEAGFPLSIAVNVSAAQFDETLADTIRKIIRETGLDSRFLNLEMTESSIMKNTEFAIRTLNDLKQLGIKISVDDFGTGYSSLGYLKSLPIDVLKIDKSFVKDVTIDPDDASLVMAIIALAHNLRLAVVAEGVETDEQLRFLNLQHCDEWQGNLFSEPLSSDDFYNLLIEKREAVTVS